MSNFKVTITFSDGSDLQEDYRALSEEGLFKELQSRKEWFITSNGASSTYKNPATIVSIKIKDIEQDNLLTEERSSKALEAAKRLNIRQ